MDRRDFLKSVGALSALSLLPKDAYSSQLLKAKRSRALAPTVIQGLTTQTSTQVAVALDKTKNIQYTLVDLATRKIIDPTFMKSSVNAKSPSRVDKVGFEELELGHEYQLNVLDKATNKNIDERILSTIDLEMKDPRIGVFSCMKADSSMRTKMWPAAEAANLDYIFMIGDNVYGDNLITHNPDILLENYIEGRDLIPFYRWKKLKPVISIWDDHDYGRNNADGTYQHKNQNLEIFRGVYGLEPVDDVLIEGPGNSRCFKAFGQTFIFADNRYFREISENGAPGFLGSQQVTWIDQMGSNSDGPVWLVEGSPFFGRQDKGANSYAVVAAQEMDRMTRLMSNWDNPALFVAGDLHYSEISQIEKSLLGYQTYEIISSSMHSSLKSKLYDNPNKSLNSYLKENFTIFDKLDHANDPSWTVSCIGEGSKVIYTNTYSLG